MTYERRSGAGPSGTIVAGAQNRLNLQLEGDTAANRETGYALSIFRDDDPWGAGVPVAYFDQGGFFYTGMAITVSGQQSTTGSGFDKPFLSPAPSSMLSLWSDLNDPTPTFVIRPNSTNGPAIHVQDSLGYRRLQVAVDGKLSWATTGSGGVVNVTSSPANDVAVDVSLFRTAACKLRVQGEDGASDTMLLINSPTANPSLMLERNGAEAFEIRALSGSTELQQAGTVVFRTYAGSSIPRVSIGADTASALFTVDSAVSTALPNQILRAHASQSLDLLELMSSGGTMWHRFNKAGYSITAKKAAPADGDLNASEMCLWLDDTNGAAKLMVKAKQADGTVRTASVALA